MMAYNLYCPLPPLSEFLQLPIDDLKRFAPRLDLQRFCDLVAVLGENGHVLTYPFFESFTITQTYEGKFETETIFGVIQFPESYLEQFEFGGGLYIIADSLWGIPTNMEKIKKLPHAPFSLYCNITRRESFKDKFDHFRHFDAIFLEIDRLSNHSITFSELLDLTKHTSAL
uniref:Uncharacterized protein n=1 Tax=Panagrolaimus sp. ES5 TaxID=591445 RepID=A0AC34GJD1_9BILA